MMGPPREPIRWTRRRWLTVFGVLLSLHVAPILYFGERPHLLPRAARSRTALHLAVDPWSAKQLAELPTLEDPALFALPSLRGFSGKAWLTFRKMEYPVIDWTEPPAYLALDPDGLGRTLPNVPATSFSAAATLGGKPADLLTVQISVPPLPAPTSSELRIEGPVQNRRLLENIEVPSWPGAPTGELLTNTVVQVLVDSEGTTLSATLLASSGSRAADDFALKRAANARFEQVLKIKPTVGPGTFGRFIFRWHTVLASETNS